MPLTFTCLCRFLCSILTMSKYLDSAVQRMRPISFIEPTNCQYISQGLMLTKYPTLTTNIYNSYFSQKTKIKGNLLVIDNDSSQLKKVRKSVGAREQSPIINLKIKRFDQKKKLTKKKKKESNSSKNSIDDKSKGKIFYFL